MSRRLGDTDKRPRKTRSDLGRKRTTYAGKPVVKKRKMRFERKIGNKEFLKIYVWEELPMSYDGRKRWNIRVRRHASPRVYKPRMVHQVHVSQINTKEKLEQFVAEHYWSGTFIVKGFSNAKNMYHCKQVRLCRIAVKETPKGNKGIMRNNYRLGRYSWFYKD